MKGEKIEFQFVVDCHSGRIPRVGTTATFSYKTDEGNLVEKDYKVNKYISSNIMEDGLKIEVWLEATEL